MQSDKADSPARGDSAGTRLAAKRAAKAAQKAATRGTSNPVESAANTVAAETTAWMDKHGRTLLIVLGAGIAIVVGSLVFSNLSQGKNREAGTLLQAAVNTSQGIVVPADETPPEDPIFPVFPSTKERDDKALGQYREVSKKFPGTRGAAYSQLGEANIQLHLGNYADAGSLFEKLRADSGQDQFLRFRVLEGAGYALEGQQKYADARARFEELSKLNNGAYRTLGDYQRARMLVAEGKRDEAKKLLEELTKAEAEKPAGAEEPAGAAPEHYESALNAAQTLLTELGGKPPERATGGGSGISQQVLDSLRKQLGSQGSQGAQGAGSKQ